MSRRYRPSTVALFQEQYRISAAAGDWTFCVTLAEQLRGLDRDPAAGAEVQYALGYAHEKLGARDKALSCYRLAVRLGSLKAARAIARLSRT